MSARFFAVLLLFGAGFTIGLSTTETALAQRGGKGGGKGAQRAPQRSAPRARMLPTTRPCRLA